MLSTAFHNFQSADLAVQAIISIESKYLDPHTRTSQFAVEGLRGGAAVLMVAAFENFLREALTGVLDEINIASPPCNFARLPIELRVASTFNGLNQALKGPLGITSDKKAQRLLNVRMAAMKIVDGKIDVGAIANTRGNPNQQVVLELFRSIGIKDIFKKSKGTFDALWDSPTATTFIQDNLETIVQRRHVVAHTASALSISRTDLSEGRRFLAVFSEVIDNILAGHIQGVIRRAR